jgi:hypothetical protein
LDLSNTTTITTPKTIAPVCGRGMNASTMDDLGEYSGDTESNNACAVEGNAQSAGCVEILGHRPDHLALHSAL